MDSLKKILFVAMQNSPHACRWINSIVDCGWDLHLFPVNHIPPLPMLRGVTIHPPVRQIAPKSFLRSLLTNSNGRKVENGLRYSPIYPVPILPKLASTLSHISLRMGESRSPVPLLHGPRTLASLIQRIKPDLIHSMEFQHCGYNVLEAKKYYHGDFPSWLATNWGSDIYHYRQFDDHRAQITKLLRNIDYYSCECDRDVSLAQELGLTAKVMPVMLLVVLTLTKSIHYVQ